MNIRTYVNIGNKWVNLPKKRYSFYCLSGIICSESKVCLLLWQSGEEVSGHTKDFLEGISQTNPAKFTKLKSPMKLKHFFHGWPELNYNPKADYTKQLPC